MKPLGVTRMDPVQFWAHMLSCSCSAAPTANSCSVIKLPRSSAWYIVHFTVHILRSESPRSQPAHRLELASDGACQTEV